MGWKAKLAVPMVLAVSGGIQAGEVSHENDPSRYLEWRRPDDARFLTAISRLTTCKISAVTDLHNWVPQYPLESRRKYEQGRVVLRLHLDPDLCIRRASIVESSRYFRLDNASLDYVMSLRLSPRSVGNIKSVEDGELTFDVPIDWKLIKAPLVGANPCAVGGRCVDEAPPPARVETKGEAPAPDAVWMPGYYVHYANTGYEWVDGRWESARPGYHWVAPRWQRADFKWRFVPGVWEPDK